jgi:hypothetical protein
MLAALNGFSSSFQGAIGNKYHVEKLDYHGMLQVPLYFVFLNMNLPTGKISYAITYTGASMQSSYLVHPT